MILKENILGFLLVVFFGGFVVVVGLCFLMIGLCYFKVVKTSLPVGNPRENRWDGLFFQVP